jgi:ribosomal-protein-alanine N-acetyltransferase
MIDPTACTIEVLSGDQDLDDVASLEGRSFTNPWTREMLARELAHSQAARVYVLRLPGQRVAAFCACWIMAGELHLNTIAVDPARRRQGLGTLLVRHVIEDARAAGVHDATLEVRRSNTAAIRLYERLGFHVEGVRTNYYSEPSEDALILWRRDPPESRHSP